MCIANFYDENTWFVVPPKPNEYVKVRWAVYSEGKFYMPKSENGVNTERLNGVVNISDLYTGNYQFIGKCAYEFDAIVKAIKPRTASVMNAPSAGYTEVNVQDGVPSTYYEIIPVNIKDVPTAIDIINAERPVDIIYYNLMGQPVANPTPGIYIKNGRKVIVR
jgi:hypothetical protein